MSDAANSCDNERGKRSPAEWVTFGIASAILLAVVALVLYDWLQTPDTPPQLSVTQGDIRTTASSFTCRSPSKTLAATRPKRCKLLPS